jgi:hypothetical protein
MNEYQKALLIEILKLIAATLPRDRNPQNATNMENLELKIKALDTSFSLNSCS